MISFGGGTLLPDAYANGAKAVRAIMAAVVHRRDLKIITVSRK